MLKGAFLFFSVEFGTRFITTSDGKQIKLQIWDTVKLPWQRKKPFYLLFMLIQTIYRLDKKVLEALHRVIIEEQLVHY